MNNQMSNDREIATAHWEYTEKIILCMLELTKTAYIEGMIHGIKTGKEAKQSGS